MALVQYEDKIKIHQDRFLQGPFSRWKELGFVFQICKEFIRGFRKLHFVGPCITIFGSARFSSDHPYYLKTIEVAKTISMLGFTIMTGGGPGIMEAANKGAKEVGGKSVGCNIILPFEQYPNRYLDLWVDIRFFFVRKVFLLKYSYGFVVMPGGFGTLDELFEAITLIQCKKIKNFPIVLIGVDYYKPLIGFIEKMVAEKTIGPEDAHLFLLTDSIEEASNYIREYALLKYGLNKSQKLEKTFWLGE